MTENIPPPETILGELNSSESYIRKAAIQNLRPMTLVSISSKESAVRIIPSLLPVYSNEVEELLELFHLLSKNEAPSVRRAACDRLPELTRFLYGSDTLITLGSKPPLLISILFQVTIAFCHDEVASIREASVQALLLLFCYNRAVLPDTHTLDSSADSARPWPQIADNILRSEVAKTIEDDHVGVRMCLVEQIEIIIPALQPNELDTFLAPILQRAMMDVEQLVRATTISYLTTFFAHISLPTIHSTFVPLLHKCAVATDQSMFLPRLTLAEILPSLAQTMKAHTQSSEATAATKIPDADIIFPLYYLLLIGDDVVNTPYADKPDTIEPEMEPQTLPPEFFKSLATLLKEQAAGCDNPKSASDSHSSEQAEDSFNISTFKPSSLGQTQRERRPSIHRPRLVAEPTVTLHPPFAALNAQPPSAIPSSQTETEQSAHLRTILISQNCINVLIDSVSPPLLLQFYLPLILSLIQPRSLTASHWRIRASLIHLIPFFCTILGIEFMEERICSFLLCFLRDSVFAVRLAVAHAIGELTDIVGVDWFVRYVFGELKLMCGIEDTHGTSDTTETTETTKQQFKFQASFSSLASKTTTTAQQQSVHRPVSNAQMKQSALLVLECVMPYLPSSFITSDLIPILSVLSTRQSSTVAILVCEVISVIVHDTSRKAQIKHEVDHIIAHLSNDNDPHVRAAAERASEGK
ncbi:hypothetical protein BLNAU_7559 [Blattamonas nauphoetae]|uniref:Uncharacterized protein n=1 Tax=Blattamonas nauphoetae TaxID=2049346 RepID=A0ABQ9Y0Y5_9EUKA|nr:hypothetical protein BLNAU_7559 [Blattamonas nauphoetae]